MALPLCGYGATRRNDCGSIVTGCAGYVADCLTARSTLEDPRISRVDEGKLVRVDIAAQARQLTGVLAPVVPRALALSEPPTDDWHAALPLDNRLVSVAVLRELRRLCVEDLQLSLSHVAPESHVASDSGTRGRRVSRAVAPRLEAMLARAESPSRDLLWALLAGADADGVAASISDPVGTDADSVRGGRHRIRQWIGHPWVRRQAVATSLNAVIVFIVIASLGYKLGWSWHNWLAFGAFKLFAIWVLSFFPGWLFVRFLGQRAAALWVGLRPGAAPARC